MPSCAIVTCRARSEVTTLSKGGITFHRFPKEPDVKEKWIDVTGREDWFPTKSSTICSKHFRDNDFRIKKSGNRYLRSGAIPSENVVRIVKSSALSGGPPPEQQQFTVDAEPVPSPAVPENQNDADFDIDEREVDVITEQQTGLEDPLANNSNHQCRFCAKNANNSINPNEKPYSKNNKISLKLNDIHVEIDLNDTHKVCLDCDRKLSEWFNFVGMVKKEIETLVIKTECESPKPDDNINEDTKEEIDYNTIDETVVNNVFTHKKRKCNNDTKRTDKRLKKPNEDIKVTSEDTELIMDIKEDPTEEDDDATNIHKAADSEDRHTGPDDKPSELDTATNALLNEMADDGFS